MRSWQTNGFLLVLILFILTACSEKNVMETKGSMEANDSINRLIISWSKDIGEINPHMYAPNEIFAQDMVYESLVRYGKSGKIEPWLAEDWEISEDGKEYTFYLRDNVRFSDGTYFTAENAKKNFDAILDNAERHSWLEVIYQIESTSVINERTFKIALKNPYYPLLQDLTLVRPFRFLGDNGFPENGKTEEGIVKAIGTGAWVLSEHKKDEYVVFTRNEYYWGEKPKIDEIEIKIIPDGEARVIAFENKEIDLILGNGLISLDSFKFLQETGNYQTGVSEPLSTRTIAINSNKGPSQELEVRQAIEYSINKQAIIDHLFYGTEIKADTLFASNVPYSDVGLKPFEYDVDKAIHLLENAGWTKGKGTDIRQKNGSFLELEIVFNATDQVQKAIAETLQGDLLKVGIKLNLVGEENQSYLQRQKDGDFNLIFNNTWGAPYEPHTLFSSMRKPAHADYQAQLGLPMKEEIDALIGEVLVTTDEEKRQEIYSYIMGTLHEQAIYLPISYSADIAVFHHDIRGVEFPNMNYTLPLNKISIAQ